MFRNESVDVELRRSASSAMSLAWCGGQKLAGHRPYVKRWFALGVGVAVVSLMALGGCQANRKEQKRVEGLKDGVRIFAHSLRWGDYRTAARFLRARPREDQEKSAESSSLSQALSTRAFSQGSVQFSRYEILEIVIDPESKKAALVGTIFQYYSRNSAGAKELVDEARWWYDEAQEAWFREDPIPEFR